MTETPRRSLARNVLSALLLSCAGTYVPHPQVTAVEISSGDGDVFCTLDRTGPDATCRVPLVAGAAYGVTIAHDPAVVAATLSDSCDGRFTIRGLDRGTWITDATGGCVLTAEVQDRGIVDRFPVAVSVTSSTTFDIAAVHVAEYRYGKRAAASYTFDDNCTSIEIAALFENSGLRATFFVIAGAILDDGVWTRWKGIGERGHELANHTMNHLKLSSPDLTDEQLTYEVDGAQALIEQKTGLRPLTLAFPQNAWDARGAAAVLRSHLAARISGVPLDYANAPLNDESTPAGLDTALANAVDARRWFVAAGHGIDGYCWRPVSSTTLSAHLATTAARRDVWVDTFGNVAKYLLARRSVHARVVEVTDRSLRIRLEGAVDPRLAGVQLTVDIPVLQWPDNIRARDASGAELPVVFTSSGIFIEARPSDEIRIEIS